MSETTPSAKPPAAKTPESFEEWWKENGLPTWGQPTDIAVWRQLARGYAQESWLAATERAARIVEEAKMLDCGHRNPEDCGEDLFVMQAAIAAEIRGEMK